MKKASAVPNDPPEVLELFSSIAALSSKANAFDGVVVRSVAIQYAKQNDFFSGAGAAKTGGRFNPIGLQAVYASLDYELNNCQNERANRSGPAKVQEQVLA